MRYRKLFLALLISVFILFFLFKIVNISDILFALKKIPVVMILLSGMFYLLSYVFRVIRFKTLNKTRIGFKSLFIVVCLHNFFNNILPARIGELSYIYLLKKRKIPISQAAASLLIARLLDLLFILMIILAIIPFFLKGMKIYWFQIVALIIILIAVITLPFLIMRFKKLLTNILLRILLLMNLNESRIKKIIIKAEEMIDSLDIIKSKRVFLKSGISTLLIIASQYLFFYFILLGLGVNLNSLKIIMAVAIVFIIYIFPVQGVVGFGTYEGAWAISLIFLGISKEPAVTAGFVMHIIQIVFFVALGILGFLLSYRQGEIINRNSKKPQTFK